MLALDKVLKMNFGTSKLEVEGLTGLFSAILYFVWESPG